MIKTYTLLAESTSPVFDLEELNLPGGTNILVVTASDGTNETEYSDEVQYEQEYKNCSIKKSTLTSIADSVRGKTGKTEPILTENIPAEIDSILVPEGTKPETITSNGTGIDVAAYEKVNVNVPIPSGYVKPTDTKSITSNGTYDVTAYAKANVNVPIPSGYKQVITGTTKHITTNGTHSTSRDSGSVYENVTVAVPTTSALQEKTVTENGTYEASKDNCDGYSKVTVNVPIPNGYIVPTGTINILHNGTGIDVAAYEKVNVAVPIPEEFDGIVTKEPGVFSELVFLNSPDVTIDLSDDMQFWTPDGVLWTGIRVDATNKQIYYVDPVDGPIVKYTESGGWVNDVHDKITVHVYGTDYYPNEYTYRGWLAANTIRQLPYAYASYNGEVIDVGTSQVIIPCKGKVMATDIIIYNDQNKP